MASPPASSACSSAGASLEEQFEALGGFDGAAPGEGPGWDLEVGYNVLKETLVQLAAQGRACKASAVQEKWQVVARFFPRRAARWPGRRARRSLSPSTLCPCFADPSSSSSTSSFSSGVSVVKVPAKEPEPVSESGVQPATSFSSAHRDASITSTASSGPEALIESSFYVLVRSGAAQRMLAGASCEEAVDAAIREVKRSYYIIPDAEAVQPSRSCNA